MIVEKVRRLWFGLEDRMFDLRHGIDTSGIVPPSASAAGPHAPVTLHATAYQAVWTRNLRVLLREARKRRDARVFVDIGAGKGKACIYAATRFARVIGVEYAAPLLDDARENARRAGLSNVEFIHADAAQYDLPDEPALVFMFNPFDGVILGHFLDRNRARIRATGSLIAYANDLQRQILADKGFECVFREPRRALSLWR